jgi:hypothetical protein
MGLIKTIFIFPILTLRRSKKWWLKNSRLFLVLFHSISKGVSGECGRRGEYLECTEFLEEPEVLALIYKMLSWTIGRRTPSSRHRSRPRAEYYVILASYHHYNDDATMWDDKDNV